MIRYLYYKLNYYYYYFITNINTYKRGYKSYKEDKTLR